MEDAFPAGFADLIGGKGGEDFVGEVESWLGGGNVGAEAVEHVRFNIRNAVEGIYPDDPNPGLVAKTSMSIC